MLTDWDAVPRPEINDLVPGTAHQAMLVVGVVEIVAGLLVAVRPRIGGYVVAAWLAGIIVNLLLIADFYDVALRDFGLLLAALALARLAVAVPAGARPAGRRAASRHDRAGRHGPRRPTRCAWSPGHPARSTSAAAEKAAADLLARSGSTGRPRGTGRHPAPDGPAPTPRCSRRGRST